MRVVMLLLLLRFVVVLLGKHVREWRGAKGHKYDPSGRSNQRRVGMVHVRMVPEHHPRRWFTAIARVLKPTVVCSF